MKYAVLIEPVEESEGMPGFYYAHVPSLGITTHGGGIEGAMAAARDLISLWVEEMRAVGKDPKTPGESILATLEVA
jgi:predicted RNase H-like HicB family nuclease